MLKINYLVLVLVITIESFNYVSTIDRFCLGKMSRWLVIVCYSNGSRATAKRTIASRYGHCRVLQYVFA